MAASSMGYTGKTGSAVERVIIFSPSPENDTHA